MLANDPHKLSHRLLQANPRRAPSPTLATPYHLGARRPAPLLHGRHGKACVGIRAASPRGNRPSATSPLTPLPCKGRIFFPYANLVDDRAGLSLHPARGGGVRGPGGTRWARDRVT
jgi:hypothetical protein